MTLRLSAWGQPILDPPKGPFNDPTHGHLRFEGTGSRVRSRTTRARTTRGGVPHAHEPLARGLTTLALSARIVAGSGIAAWAHECSNVSRSAKGDAKAAAGNGWTLTSDIILMFGIPEELHLPPLTEEQLAEAQAVVAEEKASGEFDELYARDRAVLDHSTAMNGNARNGYTPLSDDEHAIEHLFADFDEVLPLFEHLAGIYAAVTA